MTVKPIETQYNGYKFRSRLEARWAVFFDTLGVEYQYEPEGFDLSDCELIDHFGDNTVEYRLQGDYWYLPDFYLPGQDCFIEIKPTFDLGEQIYKPEMFARCSGKDVFVFMGEPYQGAVTYLWLTKTGYGLFSDYPLFKSSVFTDRSFIQFMHPHYPIEEVIKLSSEYVPEKDEHACYVFDRVGGNPAILSEYQATLIKAYEAARQARFGKSGRG